MDKGPIIHLTCITCGWRNIARELPSLLSWLRAIIEGMDEEEKKALRRMCMKAVDQLDRLTVEITVAKVTLEDINTKLMFDLRDEAGD